MYDTLIGPGKIADLFAKPGGGGKEDDAEGGTGTVSLAQQVMDENTTQLDTHEEKMKHDMAREHDEKETKEKKRSIFSRFTRK